MKQLIAMMTMLGLGAACASQPKPVNPPAAIAGSPAPAEAPPGQPTLYDRLGGLPAIQAVVAEFQKNVAKDERINAPFGLADLQLLNERLVTFFCQATGGPCRYEGRDMKSAHAGMGVTGNQFGALVEALVASLTTCGVPEAEQREILGALAPLQGDIVEVEQAP